ncbi:hypothetical protein B0H15DRAFT_799367 [Mycena belliarum]|uniref:Uncharacterized protein n=1 Tax=Mycena belliarum TaxID=1033014 RepID=A0AAD6U813_9AGAR|nr:hypothetical protein B0H15DRAFT_799367 [Mycena belliae]
MFSHILQYIQQKKGMRTSKEDIWAARKRHYDKKFSFRDTWLGYYFLHIFSAVSIREKKRQQMAEKRAAIKAKRRRTDAAHAVEAAEKSERDQTAEAQAKLERAEAAASSALALMLEMKELKARRRIRLARVSSPLPPSSEEEESDTNDSEAPEDRVNNSLATPVPLYSISRRRKLRFDTPPPESPGPPEKVDGTEEKLPSFYDTLWMSLEGRWR